MANDLNKKRKQQIELRRINPNGKTLLKLTPEDDAQFSLPEEEDQLNGTEFAKLQLKITAVPNSQSLYAYDWEITQAFLILPEGNNRERSAEIIILPKDPEAATNLKTSSMCETCNDEPDSEPPSYNECCGEEEDDEESNEELEGASIGVSEPYTEPDESNRINNLKQQITDFLNGKFDQLNLRNFYVELPVLEGESPLVRLSQILEYADYDPTDPVPQHQIPIKQIISVQQLAEQHEHYDIDVEMDKFDLENFPVYYGLQGRLTLGSGPFKATFVKHSPDEFVTVCQCVNCMDYRQIIMKYVSIQLTETKMLETFLKVFTNYYGSLLKSPSAYNTFQGILNQNKEIYWLTCGLLYNANIGFLRNYDHKTLSNNVVMVLFSSILMIANPFVLLQILAFRVEAVVKAYAAGYKLSLQDPVNLSREEAEVMLEYIITGYEEVALISEQVGALIFAFEKQFLRKLLAPWELLCKRLFQHNVFLPFEDSLLSALLTLKELPMTERRAELIKKFILLDEDMKNIEKHWPYVWMEINKYTISAPEYERRSNMSDVYRIFKSLATDAMIMPDITTFINGQETEESISKSFLNDKDNSFQWLYCLHLLVNRWNISSFKPPNTTVCDDKCVNCNDFLCYHVEKCECIACSIAGSPLPPKNYIKGFCEICYISSKNSDKDGGGSKDLYESKLLNICANDDQQANLNAKNFVKRRTAILKALEEKKSSISNESDEYHIAWAVFRHLPERKPFTFKTLDAKHFCINCERIACIVAKKILTSSLHPTIALLLAAHYQPLDVGPAELCLVAPNLRLFHRNMIAYNLTRAHHETMVKVFWTFVLSLFAEHHIDLKVDNFDLSKSLSLFEVLRSGDLRIVYKKIPGDAEDNKFFEFLQFINSHPCVGEQHTEVVDRGFGENLPKDGSKSTGHRDEQIPPQIHLQFKTEILRQCEPVIINANNKILVRANVARQYLLPARQQTTPQNQESSQNAQSSTPPVVPHPHQLHHQPKSMSSQPDSQVETHHNIIHHHYRNKRRMLEQLNLEQEQEYQKEMQFLQQQHMHQQKLAHQRHEMMRKQRLQQAHQSIQGKQQLLQKQQFQKLQLQKQQQLQQTPTGSSLNDSKVPQIPLQDQQIKTSEAWQKQLEQEKQRKQLLLKQQQEKNQQLQQQLQSQQQQVAAKKVQQQNHLASLAGANQELPQSSSPPETTSPSSAINSNDAQAKRNAKQKKCKSCFEHPELSEHCLNGHCSKKRVKKDCSHARVNETRDRLRKKLNRLASARKNDQSNDGSSPSTPTTPSNVDSQESLGLQKDEDSSTSNSSSSSTNQEAVDSQISSHLEETIQSIPKENENQLDKNTSNNNQSSVQSSSAGPLNIITNNEEKNDGKTLGNMVSSESSKIAKGSKLPSQEAAATSSIPANEKKVKTKNENLPDFNSFEDYLLYVDKKIKLDNIAQIANQPHQPQPSSSKKAAKKAKQKMRKEEAKRIAELVTLRSQYQVIYFKEFINKLNLKNLKSSKKRDKKKITEMEGNIKNLQRSKAKIEMNILELIATVKQTNSEFKFSYLPTKEQQMEKLQELEGNYLNGNSSNLNNKSDIDKIAESLMKMNLQHNVETQTWDASDRETDGQTQQNSPVNAQGNLINQGNDLISNDYEHSQAADYPYPLHIQPKPVALSFLGKPLFQPMCYGQPQQAQQSQPMISQQVVSEASSDSSNTDPSKRIVTIRRVNMPNASEPQVTVTAKGASPDKDKLLYTFVNGQMVPTTACSAADMKNGVHYFEFPQMAAMTTMPAQMTAIPTQMTASQMPMHVPVPPAGLVPMPIPIQMRYPAPHLLPAHPILLPATHQQQVPVSMYQAYETMPSHLQTQQQQYQQMQPTSTNLIADESGNSKKKNKKNKKKAKQEGGITNEACEEAIADSNDADSNHNQDNDSNEEDLEMEEHVEVKLSKRALKKRAAAARKLEQQIAEAAAAAAAAQEKLRLEQEKQMQLQQQKEKQQQLLQQQKLKQQQAQKKNPNQSQKSKQNSLPQPSQKKEDSQPQQQQQKKNASQKPQSQPQQLQQQAQPQQQKSKQSKNKNKPSNEDEEPEPQEVKLAEQTSTHQTSKKNVQNKQNKNSKDKVDKEKEDSSNASKPGSRALTPMLPSLSKSSSISEALEDKQLSESSERSKRQKIVDKGQFDNNPYKALHMSNSDTDYESSRPTSPESDQDVEPLESDHQVKETNDKVKSSKKSKQQQVQQKLQQQKQLQQQNQQKTVQNITLKKSNEQQLSYSNDKTIPPVSQKNTTNNSKNKKENKSFNSNQNSNNITAKPPTPSSQPANSKQNQPVQTPIAKNQKPTKTSPNNFNSNQNVKNTPAVNSNVKTPSSRPHQQQHLPLAQQNKQKQQYQPTTSKQDSGGNTRNKSKKQNTSDTYYNDKPVTHNHHQGSYHQQRTGYNSSTYYKNNEYYDSSNYYPDHQGKRYQKSNQRHSNKHHQQQQDFDESMSYYKSKDQNYLQNQYYDSDRLSHDMQKMNIGPVPKTYAQTTYGSYNQDQASIKQATASTYSIMDQLKSGVQVENLSLPPGITLTKVDPVKSEQLRQKSESIKKLSQPLQTEQQPPQITPGATIIAPPFGNYYSNTAPYATVASTLGPTSNVHRLGPNNGVIMVEANTSAAPHQTRSRSNESCATTSSGKSSKNKKRKNKAKKSSTNDDNVGKTSPLAATSSVNPQPKMITLRNPMFHGPDAARILQENHLQTSRSLAANVLSPPTSAPPIEQHAAIIKNENGIYTIRNPALHHAVTNGLAASGFHNLGNVSYYTPQEAAAEAAKANAAKIKEQKETASASIAKPLAPQSTSFSYFSTPTPEESSTRDKSTTPNNLNNISISCTSVDTPAACRMGPQNFSNNGTDLDAEIRPVKKPLSAIGSEIKSAQQQRQKPIAKESGWPGFGLDLAESCVYRSGAVTASAPSNNEYQNVTSLQDQYRKSSYYNGFDSFPSSSSTSNNGRMTGSVLFDDSHMHHSCGDDSPPPTITGYNSYLEGIPNTGVIRYDDASFLKTLIPGQRLNNEVSIHNVNDSNFSRNSTSPLAHRVEISPIYRTTSPTGNVQKLSNYRDSARDNLLPIDEFCEDGSLFESMEKHPKQENFV